MAVTVLYAGIRGLDDGAGGSGRVGDIRFQNLAVTVLCVQNLAVTVLYVARTWP
jgi:hypothetical protein